jgi:effector-binding domain-containing protein
MVEDMVRKIVIGLAALVALLVGVAVLLPATVQVERSAVIKASAEEVFVVINDLTRFKEWASWSETDPGMTITLSGPPMGAGASLSWRSDAFGSGTLEITESTPFKVVATRLDFGSSGGGKGTLSLAPVDGGTKVTWVFETKLGFNPVERYMGLMMDTWVGADYERSLARLKALVEPVALAGAPGDASDESFSALAPDIMTLPDADPAKGPEIVTVTARTVIRTRGSAALADDTALSAALGEAYGKILSFAEQNGLEAGGGAPQAVTLSNENGIWNFEASMPLAAVPEGELVAIEGVSIGKSYAGRAIKVTHKGSYSTLNQAYERLRAFARENKLKEKGVIWEEYVGDPAQMEDDALLTNVYIAID